MISIYFLSVFFHILPLSLLFLLGLSIKSVLVWALIHSSPSCSSPRPLYPLLLLTPSFFFYLTTSSPTVTFGAYDNLSERTSERDGVWRKECGGSSDRCKGPESLQLWERTIDPAYIEKESRDGFVGGSSFKRGQLLLKMKRRMRERARGAHEMEWSNINAVKSPFSVTISSPSCSSVLSVCVSVVKPQCMVMAASSRDFIAHSNLVLCLCL